jgi:DNA primase
MEVDGCSFKEAIEILGGEIESSWEDLHKKVEELFSDPTKSIQDAEFIQEKTKFNLPEYSYPILDLPEWNPFRKKAEQYLKKRKIEIGNLLVAIKGRYYNRLVIPYYDKNNNLIYYNCRTLGKEVPKYLGPIKNELLNIGKDDVIFMPKWANHNSKLYLTEGEFDSITLFQCGLSSAALGGKNLSNYHVEVLKNYQLVVALDADNAGKLGLKSIAGEGSKLNTDSILFVRPPKEFKDWNEFYINYDASIVNKYIKTQEKPYYPSPVIGDWKSIELDCDDLN